MLKTVEVAGMKKIAFVLLWLFILAFGPFILIHRHLYDVAVIADPLSDWTEPYFEDWLDQRQINEYTLTPAQRAEYESQFQAFSDQYFNKWLESCRPEHFWLHQKINLAVGIGIYYLLVVLFYCYYRLCFWRKETATQKICLKIEETHSDLLEKICDSYQKAFPDFVPDNVL
jgi:hypothetical protein